MRYRTLGRTGIKVSPYCLGAMMFGGIGNPDHDDCARNRRRTGEPPDDKRPSLGKAGDARPLNP